jgi:predicted SAM-dependent methyltransferase
MVDTNLMTIGGRLRTWLRGVTRARRLARAVATCKRLHLACGKNVIPGWVNIDIEAGNGVYAWDLRRPLPIPDSTIELIYSEHFLEHIELEQGEALLRDCLRALIPGGIVRLSTPDLDFMVGQYREGKIEEWSDMNWSPATPCRMVNEGMRQWGHLFVYDRPELHALLRRSGFSNVRDVAWRESPHPALCGIECRPYHHEIIVEAVR